MDPAPLTTRRLRAEASPDVVVFDETVHPSKPVADAFTARRTSLVARGAQPLARPTRAGLSRLLFRIHDEKFIRRSGDDQPQVHAFWVGEPRWADARFRVGGPANWPDRWEASFGLKESDGLHEEISPYELRER
ncbi:hypothetical protein [Streptomyces sp. NPDC053069]|uniref:hypothetical protein n=1 Tax=Streptomyces sp. NPDC053069 TaxID=3365695 RepID=UPI0037CD2697